MAHDAKSSRAVRGYRLAERYTAAGGWYCVTEDTVHFGWPVPNVQRAMATREIYREIEGDPDRLAAIKTLVRERCLMA